jgi:hypothetical protein
MDREGERKTEDKGFSRNNIEEYASWGKTYQKLLEKKSFYTSR